MQLVRTSPTRVRCNDCGRELPSRSIDLGKVFHRCHEGRPEAHGQSLVRCPTCPGNVRIKVHRGMPAESLAELLRATAAQDLPEGWQNWTVTHAAFELLLASGELIPRGRFLGDVRAWSDRPEIIAAHAHALRRQLASPTAYPTERFSGRGIVIVGGGEYFPGAYVAARMARHCGWRGPIQIWHRGEDEPVDLELLRPLDVEVVDSYALRDAGQPRRVLGGWENKTFAILNCPFQEVLYLDADAYPVDDPTPAFETNPWGAIFWPDFENADHNLKWRIHGLNDDGGPGLQGGHLILDKRRCCQALELADWINDHSDFYYQHQFGDQDSWRLAFRLLEQPFWLAQPRPIWIDNAFVQAMPQRPSKPLFVHRCQGKMFLPAAAAGLRGARPYNPRLPLEDVAWGFLRDYVERLAPSAVAKKSGPW